MILDKEYQRDTFFEFLENFLPKFDKDIRPIVHNKFFQESHSLGLCEVFDLQVLELSLNGSLDKRVSITTEAFKLMKAVGTYKALVVFWSKKEKNWRLSLMTATPTIEDGKVVTKLSNPRRFSYLLGPSAKTVTPNKYLVREGVVHDIEDLKQRFSVEVVNKEFYESIAELYNKLVGGKRKKGKGFIEYPGMLKIHGKPDQSLEHQEFAVRLIGRLVFCWFLREKRSEQGISLIPEAILSSKAVQQPVYYHQVLEPLFFEVLNKKVKGRQEPFRCEPYSLVPYLNGGLFSPQKGYGGDYYVYSDLTEGGQAGVIEVPDEWLQEFTALLDRYNFTVDENTSYDVDLSVDPEMLGRIFENLLAEINPETGESARKSTGSFYTPRSIVEFMVDRSLIYYLHAKAKIDTKKIEALVSYDLLDDEDHPLSDSENNKVIDALSKLTVLDPACGSGAFPIGILQKIVFMLQRIDPEAKKWLEKQLSQVSPELRRHLESQYKHKNYDYLRKLGVIRESIYGVDIQPIATEIARLRCFLTLIVEENVNDTESNRGIEPLPNLDFKFVSADSLRKLPDFAEKQQQMFEDTENIDELKKLSDQYFGAAYEERGQLQADFKAVQKEMLLKNLDVYKGSASKLTDTLSRWEPFENQKVDWFDSEWMFGVKEFDIVIGNPPWGQKAVKFTKEESKYLSDHYPSTSIGIKDISRFFIEKSISSLSSDGIYTNILPDIILLKNYDSTRKFILDSLDICDLDHWGMCFENVNLESFTLIGRKSEDPSDHLINVRIHNDGSPQAKQVKQSMFYKIDGYKFNLHIGADEIALIKKISKDGLFGDLFVAHEGIHTGNVRSKLLLETKNNEQSQKFILGRDEVARYKLSWSGKWINYDPNFINRKAGEYAGLGKPNYFDNPKIVVRRTGDYVLAAEDEHGFYFSNNVFVCLPKNETINLSYAVGILNSKLATWFYRTSQPRTGKLFAELKINLLSKMPFKIATQQDEDKIVEHVKRIGALLDKDRSADISSYEKMIDQIVYKVFGLTNEEIELVENRNSVNTTSG